MSTPAEDKRLHRIAIFSDAEEERETLSSKLSSMSHYRAGAYPVAALYDKRVEAGQADVVVLDVGEGALLDDEAIYEARRGFPAVPLVVLGDGLDGERIRRVMRLDAGDLLFKPVEGRKLIDAVDQLLGARVGGTGQVTAVVSAAGGSGGTSLAITTAEKLFRDTGRSRNSTCLVDLDFSAASCGWYLDALSDYDLADVLEVPDRLDAEFLELIRKEVEAGYTVYSFQRPELGWQPRAGDLVLRMLDIMAFQYRNVVLDVPYWDAPWKGQVLEAVNDVVIVTVATIPALKQARELYQRLERVRGTAKGLTVVVNRFHRRLFSKGLAKSDVQRVFKDRPLSFIGEDGETMTEAVNRGVAPSEINPRARFVKEAGKAIDAHRKRLTAIAA